MQIIVVASGNLIHASVISVYFCLLCCCNSQTTCTKIDLSLCLGTMEHPMHNIVKGRSTRQHELQS